MAQGRSHEDRQTNKPTMVARANISPTKHERNDQGRWITIGAAWTFTLDDGTEALSVRLNSVPLNWDGSFTLLPRRDDVSDA